MIWPAVEKCRKSLSADRNCFAIMRRLNVPLHVRLGLGEPPEDDELDLPFASRLLPAKLSFCCQK
jgi:hypothetical protein